MSIANEISRIKAAKESLKLAINAKGGKLTDELIDQYAIAVEGLPDLSGVTVTADSMLSGVVAVGKNGETIVGNIETAIPTVSANIFTVAKGFVAESTELKVPEATVTETETQVTVTPGYVAEKLDFTLGEPVEYGVIDDTGLFQKLDLAGDAPVNAGDAVEVANAGVFATGMDEADYSADLGFFDPSEPFDPDKPLTFTLMPGSPRATVNILSLGESTDTTIDLYYRYGTSGAWNKYTGTEEFSLTAGGGSSVQFWNTAGTFNTGEIDPDDGGVIASTLKGYSFQISGGLVGCSGNIASLINYSSELPPCCFARLFKVDYVPSDGSDYIGNNLAVAPALPFTKLAVGCYKEMFESCSSLFTAPELPALELAPDCYWRMFAGCTSLVTAPELPATKMYYMCYGGMFLGCTSLTTAPELPALELAQACYDAMFHGCSSLTKAPEKLPATELVEKCYWLMFYECSSLTKAPEIFAEGLGDHNYFHMFDCCFRLNEIRVRFTSWGEYGCNYWVSGVGSSGKFYKPSALPVEYGVHYIPEGWSVVNID